MDYESRLSLSRIQVREISRFARRLLKIKTVKFPVLKALEKLIDKFPYNLYYCITAGRRQSDRAKDPQQLHRLIQFYGCCSDSGGRRTIWIHRTDHRCAFVCRDLSACIQSDQQPPEKEKTAGRYRRVYGHGSYRSRYKIAGKMRRYLQRYTAVPLWCKGKKAGRS